MLAAYSLARYRGADPTDPAVLVGALLEARFYQQFDRLLAALFGSSGKPPPDAARE